MAKSRRPYPLEFRQRMLELVRAGGSRESSAQEFVPSAQCIRNWLRQAERDEGRRSDGVTTDERAELQRLRRENATLREEREILIRDVGTWRAPLPLALVFERQYAPRLAAGEAVAYSRGGAPAEAAGAVDAQNASTAPWKTKEQVFHSYHRASSSSQLSEPIESVNLSTKPGRLM
jgi:transposase